MTNQEQLRKAKYRNWIKGGLALKFLKDCFAEFVDVIAKQEHERLIKSLPLPAGKSCNQCHINTLQPLHTVQSETRSRKKVCPKGQPNCNCIHGNIKVCPNQICDVIYEEILNNHVTFQPNWKNTDIKKWTTKPWEMIKCFINALGYEKTKSAADTDIAGLLHVIINGRQFQRQIDDISLFYKVRDWRNNMFHSPDIELEDDKLKDGISDIVSILVDMDKKNVKGAKQAILNVKGLQSERFIITIENEAEVCRDAFTSLEKKIEELNRSQKEMKKDMASIQEQAQRLQEASDKSLKKVQSEVSFLSERVNRHDEIIQSLEERVTKTEEDVLELRKIQTNRKEHLMKTSDIISVKQKLVSMYQKDYVKTSVSPLQTKEHTIEISEVYVPPEMKKITEEETDEMGNSIPRKDRISDYGDIFSSDGKSRRRIYILGDVGSGKSAFCKMMISSWCKSKETLQAVDGDKNLKVMQEFDFLFYIPLCCFSMLQGCSDIRDMVLKYYEKISRKETLNDILTSMPERCIILADGLDEWKPKEDDFRREDETFGLPTRDNMDTVTVLTTSRPSAQGIINMTSSDYDCKIILRGIGETSVVAMVKNYLSQIHTKSGKHPSTKEIIVKLEQVEIRNLEKTPLLLQYIIWLSCTENEIGKSVSEVYSNLVNLSMRWAEKKSPRKQQKVEVREFKMLAMPGKIKQDFPACDSHRSILFVVSELAFEILTQKSKMHFGRRRLEEYGVDDDLLSNILQSGLLTEERRLNPIPEDTQFTFTHTSFVEFFAALFVASHAMKVDDSFAATAKQSQYKKILESLFGTYQSAESVLQLENALVMVCGLAPKTTHAVCHYIYNTCEQDSKFSGRRIKLYEKLNHDTSFDNQEEYVSMTKQCMKLVHRCVSECNINDPLCDLCIPLLDVVIDFDFNRYRRLIIELADPHMVRHLMVKDILPHFKVNSLSQKDAGNDFQRILKFKELHTISIVWFNLTHTELAFFAGYITETVTLRHIHISDTSHSDHHRKSPSSEVIDLSRHVDLQTLTVSSKTIRFHEINTKNLEKCILDGVRLTFLAAETPKLSDLKLSYIPLKHNEFSSLVETVTQAVLLKDIRMWGISCSDHEQSCSHEINLSGHDQLQILEVTDNESVQFTQVNTSNLQHCITDRADLVQWLKDSCNLQELDLRELEYSRQEHETLLTMKMLKKVKLRWTNVKEGVLVLTPELNSLKYVKLQHVAMSLSSWKIFVDSLLTLNQSITVERHWPLARKPSARRRRTRSIEGDITEADARDYVISHKNEFAIVMSDQFMPDDLGGFTFKTLKKIMESSRQTLNSVSKNL